MKNSESLSADRITFGESLIAIEICSFTMNIIRIATLDKWNVFILSLEFQFETSHWNDHKALKNEHINSFSAVVFVEFFLSVIPQDYIVGQHNPCARLHNVADAIRRLQLYISREAPCNRVTKRNQGNEKNNDDEADVARFNFKCLQWNFNYGEKVSLVHLLYLENNLKNWNFWMESVSQELKDAVNWRKITN